MKTETTADIVEKTAILNCRIQRRPTSLAGMHYWLEPGKMVYVFYKGNTFATVSTVPEKDRISDDCFRVPLSALTFDVGYNTNCELGTGSIPAYTNIKIEGLGQAQALTQASNTP